MSSDAFNLDFDLDFLPNLPEKTDYTFDASKVHLFDIAWKTRFFSNQKQSVLHPVSANP